MMNNKNENTINVDVLCVLKLAPKNNLLMLDFEPIERTLDDDFKKTVDLVKRPEISSVKIFQSINRNPKLRVLFEKFDYCKILNEPWQERIPKISLASFEKESSIPYKTYLIEKRRKGLLQDLEDRLKAYYLSRTIKIAEQKRKKQELIAYSHRKIGWSTPVYHLNTSFSLEIKTNFGFGSVSYFYIRFIYKNVNVIPFSQWIEYEYANKFELIRYSQSYYPDNASWSEAFTYACDACNLFLTNEPLFIQKYLIDECEKMVKGLEVFLTNSSFKFLNRKNKNTYTRYRRQNTNYQNIGSDLIERIYTDSYKKGHGLIEFRGEKISGALDFIEEISTMKEVIEIEGFIKRIIKCNKSVKPILANEIKLINGELKTLIERFKVVETEYEEAKTQENKYLEERKILRAELIEKHGEPYKYDFVNKNSFSAFYPNLKPFQDIFLDIFPKYQSFMNKYEEIYKRYKTLKDQIDSLTTVKKNIKTYKKSIEDFFKISRFSK